MSNTNPNEAQNKLHSFQRFGLLVMLGMAATAVVIASAIR